MHAAMRGNEDVRDTVGEGAISMRGKAFFTNMTSSPGNLLWSTESCTAGYGKLFFAGITIPLVHRLR